MQSEACITDDELVKKKQQEEQTVFAEGDLTLREDTDINKSARLVKRCKQ